MLAGLQPGIVAALVQMDADTDGLETVLSVDRAINILRAEADEPGLVEDEPGPGADDEADDGPPTGERGDPPKGARPDG